ncbi:MAG: ABC transporter substrate-binding protein [Candidatus Hodarchaeales archaeon]
MFPGTTSHSGAVSMEDEIKNPGKFILGRNDLSQSFDPASVNDYYAAGIMELVYETLLTYKGNSVNTEEIRGGLATDWTISEDGLTYTFTLRQNVSLHDGVPFNAYVMKYSLDRNIICGDPYGSAGLLGYTIKGGGEYLSYTWDHNVSLAIDYLNAGGIRVIDDFTLEINLEWLSVSFISDLTDTTACAVSPKAVIENRPLNYTTNTSDNFWGMVPLDAWFPELQDYTKLGLPADYDPADSGVVPGSYDVEVSHHEWMRDHMVGTGPYKLVEIRRYNFFRLEKNTNWWGTFSEHSVDEITIKHETKVETLISDLKSGDVDMIRVKVQDYPELEGIPGTKVFDKNTFAITSIFMNWIPWPGWGVAINPNTNRVSINESVDSTFNASQLSRYSTGIDTASQNNPFSSLIFRIAFSMIFDYDIFINQVSHGYGERMEGIIPNGMFGHHDQLIEEGYLPKYNPEKAKALFQQVGWKGTIVIPYVAQDYREEIAYLLKNAIELLDVGIQIQIEPLSEDVYFDTFWQFPVFFVGFTFSSDPFGPVSGFYHGLFGGMAQTYGYNNPDMNDLIDQVAVERNVTLREQLFHEIEEFAANDCPILYVMQDHESLITKDWIQNVETSGSLNPMSYMLNLESIDKTYDTVPPSIANIYHTPVAPTPSDTVEVYADINDDSGIQSATIHYRINGGSWNNVSMGSTSSNYMATIGSFDLGSLIEYYISAIDNSPKQNSAFNDNNGIYFKFIVSAVTTTTLTTQPSSERSGFNGNELVVLSFLAILTIFFFRRKKKLV